MEDWEKALNTFLESWKEKEEVVGALVCGSYVVGNPTKHSDIDVHIILKEGTTWRERGNKVVNGFLIEYFANPPEQIIVYFTEDHEGYTQDSFIQFLTGKIMFDDGSIEKLKSKAEEFYNKRFNKQPKVVEELNKYAVWDLNDNVENAFEEKDSHFWFVYHNSLNKLIEIYCKFKQYPIIKFDKSLGILSDEKVRKKYMLSEFPDAELVALAQKALVVEKKDDALQLFKELSNHVLDSMGGFNIDGWKLKSDVDA